MWQRTPIRRSSLSMPDFVLQVADSVGSLPVVRSSRHTVRYVLGFFLLAIVVLFWTFVDVSSTKQDIVTFLQYVNSFGYAGPLVYCLVHTFAVAICFPATILFEFGAGFLYGIVGGVFIVLVAKTLGACIAFVLGRTLLRGWVKAKVARNERFANVFKNIGKDGWKFAFLLRLSPLPSWLNNYGLALTDIRFTAFFFATIIGTVPMIAQNVYVGTLVEHARHFNGDLSALAGGSWTQTAFLLVGFVATLVISRMIYKYAADSMPRDLQTSGPGDIEQDSDRGGGSGASVRGSGGGDSAGSGRALVDEDKTS